MNGETDNEYVPRRAADDESVPTQVARPWQATLRSAWQTFLACIIAFPLIVGAVEAGMDTYISERTKGMLAVASAFATALAATITRVMAIPEVNRLLGRIGLGA